LRARSNPGEGVNVEYQHHKGEMSHNKATKGIKHHQEEEDHHRNEEMERSSEESLEVLNHGISYSGTGLGPLTTELQGRRAVLGALTMEIGT
jgi:hypothetical protein